MIRSKGYKSFLKCRSKHLHTDDFLRALLSLFGPFFMDQKHGFLVIHEFIDQVQKTGNLTNLFFTHFVFWPTKGHELLIDLILTRHKDISKNYNPSL